MTFIKGHSLVPSETVMKLFTQSTAVSHKCLNTKTILFVTNFPRCCTELPDDSLSFPYSETFLSIPGMWLVASLTNVT